MSELASPSAASFPVVLPDELPVPPASLASLSRSRSFPPTPAFATTDDTGRWTSLRESIRDTIVLPSYIRDAKNNASGRYNWNRISEFFSVLGEIIVVGELLLSAAAKGFNEVDYSFYSLIIGLVAVAARRFAIFSKRWSARCNRDLNVTLGRVLIEPIAPFSGIIDTTAPDSRAGG